jgi:hypothetical protein
MKAVRVREVLVDRRSLPLLPKRGDMSCPTAEHPCFFLAWS